MIKGQKKILLCGNITEEIKKYSIQYINYTIIFFDFQVFFEILSLQKYYGYKRKFTK